MAVNFSEKPAASLFSKVITLVLVFVCLGAAFYFGSQFLEPVDVPPPPPVRAQVRFNPKADVSKNEVFQRLEPYGPTKVEPGETGRLNPFAPVEVVIERATTTANATTVDSAVPVNAENSIDSEVTLEPAVEVQPGLNFE